MDPAALEAVCITVPGGFRLTLWEETHRPAGSFDIELADAWTAAGSSRSLDAQRPEQRPPFTYDPSAPERGLNPLRLFELRDYSWRVEPEAASGQVSVASSLQASVEHGKWRPQEGYGRFAFVNFLGAAWIEVTVAGYPPARISFEVASPKLDYEREYRAMVEAIGEECQQLLLDWGTPTTLNISSDPDKRAQTLLEQFLFLHHVLGPDRLELYLEVIQRQAHSRLLRERVWRPAGAADPSLFLRDPLRHGHDWRAGRTGFQPEEVCEERKCDSLDTPPNRFLKFALGQFRSLCDEVLEAAPAGGAGWGRNSPVELEARSMQKSLDAFLALPLFDDVGDLTRIPFESIALQRREGYREILHAWLMLDAAAQILWPGRSDTYKGTSRNVALLYEYWLYFTLARAFSHDLGMEPERDPLGKVDNALPFCCKSDDGRLMINLKQREASFCRYTWEKNGRRLRVHFFYNRSFGRKALGERGSYSKTFRPDFSLVIIPEEFDGTDWAAAARAAEQAGRIAYLHFDAKYRGENLPGIFGTADKEDDDPEDAESCGTGNPKNADLYKMHTYNEAIRRSVGSYVLYPGIAANPEDANASFKRYHEIIPGIGAFALRPQSTGGTPQGLPLLVGFIRELLDHHLTRFSQSYRIDYWTHSTIKDAPLKCSAEDSVNGRVLLPKANVVLGFIPLSRESEYRNEGGNPWFYCRALTPAGIPLDLNISAAQGALFVGWTGTRSGPFRTYNWVSTVRRCRFLSAAGLKAVCPSASAAGASHYLYFELDDLARFTPRDITALVKTRNGTDPKTLYRAFEVDFATLMEQPPHR